MTGWGEVLTSAGPLLILVCARALVRGWREGQSGHPRHRLVPLLLGLGVTSRVVGQAISASDRPVLHQPVAHLSWADAGYLGAYVFVGLGVLLLCAQVLPWAARLPTLLDSLMIAAALAPFGWYFILGPTIFQAGDITAARIADAAYPVCALALCWSALLLSSTLCDRRWRSVTIPLILSLATLAAADSIHAYQALHHAAGPGLVVDLMRSLGSTLLGLAAVRLCSRLADRVATLGEGPEDGPASPTSIGPQRVWRYLLPYALIPGVVALLVSMAHVATEPGVETGVYIAAALFLEVILVQQFLAYRDLIAFANRTARLERLASADPVTGLPNHRSLVSALDQELARSHRYHRPCTLLFLDLDHFKALNDTFGHRAGDAALHELSTVVRTALRSVDTVGRWGGEEFVAILPETDAEAGAIVAERIRATVASHAFWAIGGSHLTCSVGTATYPQEAEDRDGLIEMADQAMYAAKRLGRNQVRTTGEPAVTVPVEQIGKPGSREEAAVAGTVEALAAVVQSRDQYTGGHVEGVAALAVQLALALGLEVSEAHAVGLAGRLHDIGKVAIPDAVLQKPAPLSADEWALMRTHSDIGATIVSRVPALRRLAPIIRAHHERWDGNGYPDRLSGNAIPFGARILAVADTFSAMTSDRPYCRARDKTVAVHEIYRCSGTQFDPRVVDALGRVLKGDHAGAA